MYKVLPLINLISVILVISVNYCSQVLRFNDTTIGEMSNNYSNLFTPANYAFSIWGLIFLSLFALGIFQVNSALFRQKHLDFMVKSGYWFAIANLLNGLWVIAFVYDYIGMSLVLMCGILFSLIKIIINTNMESHKTALPVIIFCWWPICLYTGWIAVATIANVATFLVKIGWNGGFLTPVQWTLIMVAATVAINIFMIMARKMREFAAVGVWALIALYVRHAQDNVMIAYTALSGAIILSVAIIWHGYQNRHDNVVFTKFKVKL
ncbi:tryptophan-rich sensory protein [uncultured Winogradskyella sp.]|uniref:tryptophan-rich sensory protein n=1 Tax=uncultured Winogradskyella sp. TaxID=395353 RepID=UPI0035131090